MPFKTTLFDHIYYLHEIKNNITLLWEIYNTTYLNSLCKIESYNLYWNLTIRGLPVIKSIKRGSSNLPFTIDIVLAPVVFFRISNIVNEFYILTSKNTFLTHSYFSFQKMTWKNTEGLEEIYLVVVVSYFFRSLSKNSLKKALRRMTNDKKYFLKYIQFID